MYPFSRIVISSTEDDDNDAATWSKSREISFVFHFLMSSKRYFISVVVDNVFVVVGEGWKIFKLITIGMEMYICRLSSGGKLSGKKSLCSWIYHGIRLSFCNFYCGLCLMRREKLGATKRSTLHVPKQIQIFHNFFCLWIWINVTGMEGVSRKIL